MKNYKHATAAIIVVVLAAALMFAAISQTPVNAQETTDAIVIVQPSLGGTTEPGPGTHTYANGTDIMLTATASPGYMFQYWVASGDLTPGHTEGQSTIITDPETGEVIGGFPRPQVTGIDSLVFSTNPAVITCGYGYTYTYQAVFATTDGTIVSPTDATVVILPSSDGTTDPADGTHSYPSGTVVTLTATPNSGYSFHYWVISGNVTPGHAQGENSTIITDPETGEIIATIPRPPIPTGLDSLVVQTNPVTITCGYGYTFAYQAVFTPTNETDHSPSPASSPTSSPVTTSSPAVTVSPSPQVTPTTSPAGQIIAGIDDWVLIAIVAIVIIVIIAAVVAAMRRK